MCVAPVLLVAERCRPDDPLGAVFTSSVLSMGERGTVPCLHDRPDQIGRLAGRGVKDSGAGAVKVDIDFLDTVDGRE
jgi:hypothetical protein